MAVPDLVFRHTAVVLDEVNSHIEVLIEECWVALEREQCSASAGKQWYLPELASCTNRMVKGQDKDAALLLLWCQS